MLKLGDVLRILDLEKDQGVLRCFQHNERMEEERLVKKVYESNSWGVSCREDDRGYIGWKK